MIDSFKGKYRFLSNFYPAPVEIDGKVYATNEHFFQAMKAVDDEAHEWVRTAPTAGAAKLRGRSIAIRPDWEAVKLDVMWAGLWQKFAGHEDLGRLLLETGDQELVEGNTWGDRFFGVCGGVGENHLGKMLMEIRSHLRDISFQAVFAGD